MRQKTPLTDVSRESFSRLRREKSTPDEKVRFIKGNELKVTQVK